MALIVQKFGGTSVADPARIKEVVRFIKLEIEKNNQVIVVVSAMSGVTNQLVTYCQELSSLSSDEMLAEYDSALASGEIVTAALLALRLKEEGFAARSILAWQLPITTDKSHGKALVQSIDTKLLENCIENRIIPIIAGFQGVTPENRYSTLGRGGSDTTAALVASAIKADRCDIYTDVAGVFTADPRIVHQAKKLSNLSFEEMLEFASSGAKVLHSRCVAVALRYNIPIRVLSSFSSGDEAGTLITMKDKIMESRVISGITSNKNLLLASIEPAAAKFIKICSFIADNNVHIESISRNDVIVQLSDRGKLETLLHDMKTSGNIQNFVLRMNIAIVSIVGHGIKNDSALISKILGKLEEHEIAVETLQTSEIKVSILINDQDTEKAVRLMHELFHLER